MELSPPSEADNSSATLLSRILCDPKCYYLLYKSTPLVLILSQINSFHIHPSYKGSLSFGFSYQNCTLLSSPLHLPHAQPIPFDLTTLIIFCNNSYHEAFRYAVLVFPQYAVTSSIVGPTRSLHALSLRFSLKVGTNFVPIQNIMQFKSVGSLCHVDWGTSLAC